MSEQTEPSIQNEMEATSKQPGHAQADLFFQFLTQRMQELQEAGMPKGRARGMAMLEERISRWPPEWGNELRIIIYGDFEPPEVELHFPNLGIVVEPGVIKGSIVRPAMCVLEARVTVPERSIASVEDASARINMLLGVWAAINWGNGGSGWWCHVTHGSIAGLCSAFEQTAIDNVIERLKTLQPNVRRKIKSALHWIREPRQLVMEGYRSDVLRVYAGYWNAFECLVDAVCILKPPPSLTKQEKQEKIEQMFVNCGSILDQDFIAECYRTLVNPGFVAQASYALRQCFPDPTRSEGYITECFRTKPKQDRLYDIRNAINHGDIDAENLQELIRVEDKQRRLWFIVFGMLGQIIPVPRPLDDGHT